MNTNQGPPSPRDAFGRPGIAPRWTSSSKEGVGTAYNTASRVWFTLSHGILNEVYFPTLDSPQVRDLGYLVTDGESFFHEEKRDLETRIEYLDRYALGYRLTNTDKEGRYAIVKEVIADPHLPCVLAHTRLEGDEALLRTLHLYVLLAFCAPRAASSARATAGRTFAATCAWTGSSIARSTATWP